MHPRPGPAALLVAAVTGVVASCSGNPAGELAPASASSSSTSGDAASSPAGTDGVHLVEAGVELPDQVIVFGTPVDEALPALEAVLGETPVDTGIGESSGGAYGTCPGTVLRAVEYGDGALVLLFGDVDVATGSASPDGDLVLHAWRLTDAGDPSAVPAATALVGDVTTLSVPVGTPLGELGAAAPTDGLELVETRLPDGAPGAAFGLGGPAVAEPATPLPAGIRGTATGLDPADEVTSVEAGVPCAG